MADLLDRLAGNVTENEERIPGHQFMAALVGMADGQVDRTKIESLFGITTTGVDAAQLDFIINGYQAAADKGRYLTAVHSIVLLLEHQDFVLTKTQMQNWLIAAQSAY